MLARETAFLEAEKKPSRALQELREPEEEMINLVQQLLEEERPARGYAFAYFCDERDDFFSVWGFQVLKEQPQYLQHPWWRCFCVGFSVRSFVDT